MGRATQGVRLINLKGSDFIAAVAKVDHANEDELEDVTDENIEVTEGGETNDQTEQSEQSED
jgi:DNA gyrase subunit A